MEQNKLKENTIFKWTIRGFLFGLFLCLLNYLMDITGLLSSSFGLIFLTVTWLLALPFGLIASLFLLELFSLNKLFYLYIPFLLNWILLGTIYGAILKTKKVKRNKIIFFTVFVIILLLGSFVLSSRFFWV